MRVLITGANGQVGRALQTSAGPDAAIIATDRRVLDITDQTAVKNFVHRAAPAVIINAAAYTAVDRAEKETVRATAINGRAVGYLAQAAARTGARLVHISTDFVFDGAASRPYSPTATPNPLGVYGRSKLLGEKEAGDNALLVRTAWVYSDSGVNFVTTMLRLMRERDEIRVVADQLGTPTWAHSLADALWRLIALEAKGLHHFTDSGVASWYDLAVAIQEEAIELGLLRDAARVLPISSSEFPTAAARPAYSVLEKGITFDMLGGAAPHWRVNLRRMLEGLKAGG